jgi:hypothetical protein
MVRLNFVTNNNLYFNILLKNAQVIGFEYETGIDPEKLRSLQAYSFQSKDQLVDTINKIIECKLQTKT